MIVDPYSGQILDYGSASYAGAQAQNYAAGYGITQTTHPFMFNMMASFPSGTHTSAWNAIRGSRTIMHGGIGAKFEPKGVRQTFNPRYWGRMNDVSNVNYTEGTYTPFNALARFGNFAMRRSGVGNQLSQRMLGRPLGADETYFSSGFLSNMQASARISRLSEEKFARMVPNVTRSIDSLTGLKGIVPFNASDPMITREFASNMLAMGGRGVINQAVGGYVRGSMNLLAGKAPLMLPERTALSALGRETAVKAADLAGEHFIAEGAMRFAPRLAGMAGFAIPGVNAVMTALLIKDIAMMGASAIGAGVKGLAEAGKSIKGSIDKPIMGMGYKDNTVAATSRSRGVMAIQNSRLNMRSVLGSEAAGIHAYYG